MGPVLMGAARSTCKNKMIPKTMTPALLRVGTLVALKPQRTKIGQLTLKPVE